MHKLKLHWQILIAMVLGALIGLIFQNTHHGNPDGTIYTLGKFSSSSGLPIYDKKARPSCWAFFILLLISPALTFISLN